MLIVYKFKRELSIGPSGNTIFLPAAGIKTGLKLMYNGHEGYYWTA